LAAAPASGELAAVTVTESRMHSGPRVRMDAASLSRKLMRTALRRSSKNESHAERIAF
jgi:hypothetical protein